MMLLALAGLILPAFFTLSGGGRGGAEQHMSVAVALVLIGLYAAYIAFSFTKEGQAQLHNELHPDDSDPGQVWSVRLALAVLFGATLATVVLAELLVGT